MKPVEKQLKSLRGPGGPVLAILLISLACHGNHSFGQNSLQKVLSSGGGGDSKTQVNPESPGKTTEERLANAQQELAEVTRMSSGGITNQFAGFSAADLSLRRHQLERLVRLYEQQISFIEELKETRNRHTEVVREAQSWVSFEEPKPYSILLVDNLRESLQAESLEVSSGESALSMLATLIDEQRASLKQSEERIRQLNEQIEGAKDRAVRNEATWRRDTERLLSQLAAASVGVLDVERQVRQERLEGSRVRLELLKRQLVIAKAGAAFTDADVEKVEARLNNEQQELEGELAEAETRQSSTAKALEAARQELQQAQARPDINRNALAGASERVEARRAESETATTAVNVLRFMLQAQTLERSIWEVRFTVFRSSSVETIGRTRQRLEQFDHRVKVWKTYYRQQLDSAASQVALLETQLTDSGMAAEIHPAVQQQLAALREHDQMLLRVVRNIERFDRLIGRLGEALEEAAQDLPLPGRVQNALSDTGSWFTRLWRLELFVAQDTITVDGQQITGKRGVTLGKIITAILILAAGCWLIGVATRFAEPFFVKHFKIEANQTNLIRRWLRVVLVFCLVLFSLVSVKIPLTVFAFAGGALAIGLGFGLQTLIKNFVSGVIILFERPFRVGDVLDIAGQRGTVASIGIRSSVLQTWEGTETLIPNSTLLENNVTNWTYSNRLVRFCVTVGVAYGSDTRRVVQLLDEVAERHGLVEKDPKPQILFTNFGASALEFELRFWVDVVKANSAQIASDLRQMIVGTLTEHEIVIAFPQRDLHLDTVKPLQIQITPTAERPASNGDGAKAQPTVSASAVPVETTRSSTETVSTAKIP